MTSFALSLGHPRAANFTGYSAVSQPRQRQRVPRSSFSCSLEIESMLRRTVYDEPSGRFLSPVRSDQPPRTGPISLIPRITTDRDTSSLCLSPFLYSPLFILGHRRGSRRRARGCHRPLYPLARVCVRVHLHLARDAD